MPNRIPIPRIGKMKMKISTLEERSTPRLELRIFLAALAMTSILSHNSPAIAANQAGDLVGKLHKPMAEHVDQGELNAQVKAGQVKAAFDDAFHTGDDLFEATYNILDGGGANVGEGLRYTRVPRADLNGPGEWANHFPPRATGPNAQSCTQCHMHPADDGSGTAAVNVHRDPLHLGQLGSMIRRDTPHLFGAGALQLLAEEMTEDLLAIKASLKERACQSPGEQASASLNAKGVSFGHLEASSVTQGGTEGSCEVRYDHKNVVGVATNLIVKPFQWKGDNAFLRDFNRDASHKELGMQAVEVVGEGVDGDFDGVVNEMTVGDQTAMAIYVAAQPRPTTQLELDDLKLLEVPLSEGERTTIKKGAEVFHEIGCASCHMSNLVLNNPIYSEPSQSKYFRDHKFPGGQDPLDHGLDPAMSITFDMTKDLPDNIIVDDAGTIIKRLGSLETDAQGRAIVRLYGDLKHHEMGANLAETIDETGTGKSVWITKELWGVGSTAPYLHDGRASTLTEAILAHGGEATKPTTTFEGLSLVDQKALIAFLNNLVLFKKG